MTREVLVSPLARKLAEVLGVDLTRVTGTGPGGRITREDVETAAVAASAPAARTGATAHSPRSPGDAIPLRGMRKVIAERMHASLQDMAQLTMGMDVTMDEAVKLRAQLVDEWAPDGIRITYTDLVIKAVAKALSRHPLLNATVTATEVSLLREIHIGMAVALDDGLVVPVIRHADVLSLKGLSQESGRLAIAARSGKLAVGQPATRSGRSGPAGGAAAAVGHAGQCLARVGGGATGAARSPPGQDRSGQGRATATCGRSRSPSGKPDS